MTALPSSQLLCNLEPRSSGTPGKTRQLRETRPLAQHLGVVVLKSEGVSPLQMRPGPSMPLKPARGEMSADRRIRISTMSGGDRESTRMGFHLSDLTLPQHPQRNMAKLRVGGKPMNERWCSECGETFLPRPQSPRQAFCSKAQCQKARKLLWQRTKRHSDQDYLDNQSKANAAWARRNPDYWRHYRAREVTLPKSMRGLADAISRALQKMIEDALTPETSGSNDLKGRERHKNSKHAAATKPYVVALTLTIELHREGHVSSVRIRQETT